MNRPSRYVSPPWTMHRRSCGGTSTITDGSERISTAATSRDNEGSLVAYVETTRAGRLPRRRRTPDGEQNRSGLAAAVPARPIRARSCSRDSCSSLGRVGESGTGSRSVAWVKSDRALGSLARRLHRSLVGPHSPLTPVARPLLPPGERAASATSPAAVAPTRAIRAARRGATWARGPSGSRNRAPGRAWVSSASAASSSIWSGHEARAHRPIFARERFRRRRRGRHAVRAIELVPAWARVASSSHARAASGSRVLRASAAPPSISGRTTARGPTRSPVSCSCSPQDAASRRRESSSSAWRRRALGVVQAGLASGSESDRREASGVVVTRRIKPTGSLKALDLDDLRQLHPAATEAIKPGPMVHLPCGAIREYGDFDSAADLSAA